MTEHKPHQGTLLGVDVGNSKTHALLADSSGQVLSFVERGCGSYEVLGPEGYAQALQRITTAALEQAGASPADVIGMGFSLAGYDWPSEESIMEAGIESLGIKCPYAYVNDVEIGLLAGTSEGWGVAVDAGTGNNVRGRDRHGRTGRITGNSIRFGEFGGAGELVWRASLAVTYAWSQRGPKTALTEMFMADAGVDREDRLIELWATNQLEPAATLAIEVFRLAAEGDPVAADVIQWTAHELGENVNAVIRQLDLQEQPFEVVLIGSMFNAGEAYITPLRETIQAFAPMAQLVRLSAPPVVGSVLLAAEACGIPTGQIRPILIKSTALHLTTVHKSGTSH